VRCVLWSGYDRCQTLPLLLESPRGRIDARHVELPHSVAKNWVQPVARLGYVARGVVYLCIGYLAACASLGAGSPRGAVGALRELMLNSGRWVMLGLAIGLAAHAAWRFVQAATDPECPRGKHRRLLRGLYVVSGLANGSLAITAWKLFRGVRSGDVGDGEEEVARILLSQPLGRWLVGLVGLAFLAYAVEQVVVACRANFAKYISVSDAPMRRGVVAVGKIGILARAVVLAILGWFFIDAARRYDARAAGGTEEALRWLGHGWLLGLVAAGLIAFGLLQLAYARFRRLQAP
jgi:hypothetical protein